MKPIALLLLLLAGSQSAFAWGSLGHEAMARAAQRWLSNDVAARVFTLLGTNDLAAVSLWADHLRDAARNRGPLRNDPEAREFNRRFPDNQQWHYVNLPLGTARYHHSSRFVSTNDIVHALDRCIDVLEGRSRVMTKAHALRWLIHLVGDLHQPLHVGCGYYRFKPDGKVIFLRQPAEADTQRHDQGGNLIRYTPSQGLHAYWDVNLVEIITGSRNRVHLETVLREHSRPREWRTRGDVSDWAEQWASDCLNHARAAYKGIKFSNPRFDGLGVLTNISITLPPDYSSVHTKRARTQLSKSAFHLAELLNELHWQ